MTTLIAGPDGQNRCRWCASAPEFLAYHDTEWGFPVSDDLRLFEKICLEGFQSGLSWRTILVKRENFRSAFHGFDFNRITQFGEADIERLMQNTGIVRHRGKITSVVNNAHRACDIVGEFGSLGAYFWSFEPTPAETTPPQSGSTSPTSVTLSKDLKKRGWSFVGPTTVYAFMQAMGLINDHAIGCWTRQHVDEARKNFIKPA